MPKRRRISLPTNDLHKKAAIQAVEQCGNDLDKSIQKFKEKLQKCQNDVARYQWARFSQLWYVGFPLE